MHEGGNVFTNNTSCGAETSDACHSIISLDADAYVSIRYVLFYFEKNIESN